MEFTSECAVLMNDPHAVSNPPGAIRPTFLNLWTWFAIAVGVVLRVLSYLRDRSLWYDETLLALNVLHRSARELLSPLSYHQASPVGFLLLEKLSSGIFGKTELALRLAPLVFGITALCLGYRLAILALTPRAVPIAVMLFALNEPLVYYSSEVKQYSCDTAVALLVLWTALRFSRREVCWTSAWKFALLGCLALWFSYPAAFLLAGTGTVLLFSLWRRKQWASFGRVGGVVSAWAGSFLLLYLFSLRHLTQDAVLRDYWRAYFPPVFVPSGGSPWFMVSWFVDRWFALLGEPFTVATIGLAALFLVGLWSLLQKNTELVWMIGASSLVTVVAACLHRYPLAPRLLLFAVAISILFVAEGAARVAGKIVRSSAVTVVFLTAIFAQPVWMAASNLVAPKNPDDIRPMFLYIRAHENPGDRLYVYQAAQYQYMYYAELYPERGEAAIGSECGLNAACYASDLERLRGASRLWILISHNVVWDGRDDGSVLLAELDKRGLRLDEKRSSGARAYLYDLGKK